jgi:hypothetical protein
MTDRKPQTLLSLLAPGSRMDRSHAGAITQRPSILPRAAQSGPRQTTTPVGILILSLTCALLVLFEWPGLSERLTTMRLAGIGFGVACRSLVRRTLMIRGRQTHCSDHTPIRMKPRVIAALAVRLTHAQG